MALEVGDALDGVAQLADVEDAEGVDRDGAHASVVLVVEDGGKVRGDGGDVDLALGDERGDLVGRGNDLERVVVVGELTGVGVAHELHEAHGGGALERHGAHGNWVGRRLLLGLLVPGVRLLGGRAAAGGERERRGAGDGGL